MKLEIRQSGPRDFRIILVRDGAGDETDLGFGCPHRRAAERKAERYTLTAEGPGWLLAKRLALLKSKAAAKTGT